MSPGWPCHLHCSELFSRLELSDLGHSFSCRTLGITKVFSCVLLCSLLFCSLLFYSIPIHVLTTSRKTMLILVWNASGLWKAYSTKVTTENRNSLYFSDSVSETMLTTINTVCMCSQEQDNVFFNLALKSIPCSLLWQLTKLQCLRGIWIMSLILYFEFWSSLSWSRNWTILCPSQLYSFVLLKGNSSTDWKWGDPYWPLEKGHTMSPLWDGKTWTFFLVLEDSGRSGHHSDLTLQRYAHEDESPTLKQDFV